MRATWEARVLIHVYVNPRVCVYACAPVRMSVSMCVVCVCVYVSVCQGKETKWAAHGGSEEGSLGYVSSLYRQDPVRINGYLRSQAQASTPYLHPQTEKTRKMQAGLWLQVLARANFLLLLHLLQIGRPNLTEPVWLTWEGWASLSQNSEATSPPATASHHPHRARLPGQPGPPPPLWVFRHVQDSSVRSKHSPPHAR